ncbi:MULTISPECIES: ferredoxin [unclassified Streptomyces]|uniref:ferredoxin n=1 Tax=unclassified Streptomyces TaxID=2593676 RepID=UPI002E36718E|nr:(4Fe-4S)-binding protein [Streptomyces sp. NBC_01477]
MRIEADTDMCASSGMCALTAPDLFDQSDVDGTVLLLRPAPADTHIGDAEEAVRRCPSGALRLTD